MKISSKSRYALAALIYMTQLSAQHECITILRISDKLGISKIYLEQVFSLLKGAGLVHSIKGAGGGYQLALDPSTITAGAILRAVETSLFEKTKAATTESSIEKALTQLVWDKMDETLSTFLDTITLELLAKEATNHLDASSYMFYI